MAEAKAGPVASRASSIEHERLEDVALTIFSASLATGVHGSQMNMAAERAFSGASAFLTLSQQIESGQKPAVPEAVKGPQLQDCCAPNLPAKHPHNLIAKKHTRRDGSTAGGDLGLVAKIYDRIKGIDLTTKEDNFMIEDSELGINWDKPVIQTAQTLFPYFVESAKN